MKARNDILNATSCQILAYLNPADLVHLRKVNDVFHEFLSSPSAGLCWSTARSNWEEDNTNLPERPHDMSEVAFLEYLFAKYCHVCSSLSFRTS